ncbi:MAG: hypothetical protein AAB777_00810 [Patescibacteria group bacterium]
MYGSTAIVIVVIIIVVLGIKLFYTAPTCFDGKMNGNEQGPDCGGACEKLCPSAFLLPIVNWTRFERIAPHLYNMAAYIVNPNIDGGAFRVPYHVQLYDGRGVLITEYDGTVTLPPHRNILAFEGAVDIQERVPAKALFEFTGAPNWIKTNDSLTSLLVVDKQYFEDENGSSLIVTLKNTSVEMLGKTSVYAVLYDKDSNALGFSKTIIDGINAGATAVAPFTWPINRQGAVISIEVLPVAE